MSVVSGETKHPVIISSTGPKYDIITLKIIIIQ